MYDIAVIGGDQRQIYMIKRFLSYHLSVITYGLSHPLLSQSPLGDEAKGCMAKIGATMKDTLRSSRVVVSAIPFSKDGMTIPALTSSSDLTVSSFLNHIESGQTVFAGMFSPAVEKAFSEKNVTFYDFMKNDGVAVLNGVATAEGAIMKAIEVSSQNLHKSPVLVTGFGRCGKILAKKLAGLDCEVFVAARGETDRCLCEALGLKSLSFLELSGRLSGFRYIFNTVPSLIFDRALLSEISAETILLDIASKPGGFDTFAVKEFSLNLHHLLGIPGKVAPKASGDILVDFIFQTNALRKKVSL
jgi:dipicolinate synthase subunit A